MTLAARLPRSVALRWPAIWAALTAAALIGVISLGLAISPPTIGAAPAAGIGTRAFTEHEQVYLVEAVHWEPWLAINAAASIDHGHQICADLHAGRADTVQREQARDHLPDFYVATFVDMAQRFLC